MPPDPSPASSTEPVEAPEPLRRELSRMGLALLAINGVIGAGIFALPATAAAYLGALSPLVFLSCGLLITALMMAMAQAASYFQTTGGPILYTRVAFGSFVGFQTGWVLYVGRVTSLAANGNLFATYLAAYVDGADRGAGRIAVLGLLCASFALLNIFGVKQGMTSVLAISVVKFVPLLLFVIVGCAHLRIAPFETLPSPGYGDFSAAVLLVFYAFIGFEGALVPAGESKNPRRDLPRALLFTAGGVTALYVLIQIICIATTPNLAQTTRPLAAAANQIMGSFGIAIITLAATMSILGNFAAAVLSAPRMTYALAREGSLPRILARVHPRTQTPHVSIALYALLGFALGAWGRFQDLALMSSVARLLGYMACLVALPPLARRFAQRSGALRLPGGLWIPAGAFAVCAWLVAQAEFAALKNTALLIAAGSVLYLCARHKGPTKDTLAPHDQSIARATAGHGLRCGTEPLNDDGPSRRR